MANNPYGIVGTDKVAPFYTPNAKYEIFSMDQVYKGGPGEGRYVPKIGDRIDDLPLGLSYRVTSLDLATLICQYIEIKPIASSGEFDDILLGPGPGTQSDTYRIYLDRSVIPYSLAVDARLSVKGTMCRYARIFRGSDLTNQGNIIAHTYDSQGNIIGDMIALELVANPGNISERTVPVAYTMEDLPDNEIVTVVFYSDVGSVVSKRQLVVENTAFIRQANLGLKYITDISLKCPFLSATDSTTIELPLNVLLPGVNMTGVVHYSDGSTAELPVDGTKFAMLGLEAYTATTPGQKGYLSLRYRPSSNEVLYGGGSGEFTHKSKKFTVVAKQQEGTYSVKLFPYPVWVDAVHGYSLKWFLYNGDRNVTYDVTGLVEFPANTPAWMPTQYGVNQRITVAINLQNVNGTYKNYRHIQTVEIILRGAATERNTTNWTVGFEVGQSPLYGDGIHADLTFINSNLYKLKVDAGFTTQADWLQALYYNTKPIIDTTKETAPPVPTHYRITVGSTEYEFPISQWNSETTVGAGLVNSGTAFLRFIRRLPDTDLHLAVAGIALWQTT